MAPRASWTGHLKISLISIPVRLYTVSASSSSKVRLNMLHKDCLQRVRQQQICEAHGVLSRDAIVKGYEFEKDKYVVVDDDTLKSIRLESTKIIDVDQYIEADDVDPVYYNANYYVAPDGPVAMEAFRVFRETLRHSGKVGIGHAVLSGREHTVQIAPRDKGLMLTPLRYAKEVKKPAAYFEDIPDTAVPTEQLELFKQLIESKIAPLDMDSLVDRYEEALVEVIKAKIDGREPEVVQEQETAKAIDFMEALRASVQAENIPKKPPAASAPPKKKAAKKKKAG